MEATLFDKEEKISVVVADDHKLILDEIVQIIDSEFEVVGTAMDGNAALEMIRRLKPEIAVLDITMPFKTGIEIAAELKKSGSGVKVIVLTAHNDPEYLRAACAAGVMGYVIKFYITVDLKAALDAVRVGEKFISPSCKNTSD